MSQRPSEPFDPVLGKATARAWRTYEIRGNLLTARPRYLREQWGEDAVRDVTERLASQPEALALFQSLVLPITWYPFETLAVIDRAIIDGPMGGDVSRIKHLGETIARYDLPTLYKMVFKLGSPAFIMKRASLIYRMYVHGGTIECVDLGTHHAVIELDGAIPLYFCTHGVSGWLTAAAELSGGRRVDVREVECVHRGAARCKWQARWEQ